jgi:hypothetical protein
MRDTCTVVWHVFLATMIASTIVMASSQRSSAKPEDTLRNQSTNSVTGAVLAEKDEWIWIRKSDAGTWQRLIPGRCPQWYLNGKRFLYFLDVGYDGTRAELWSADPDGEARLRLTDSDYFIKDGPVLVSPDNRSLTFLYQTSRASGDFKDVVVVDFRPSPIKPTDGRVVFRTRSAVDPKTLSWQATDRLSVVVAGVRTDIDASVTGLAQAP